MSRQTQRQAARRQLAIYTHHGRGTVNEFRRLEAAVTAEEEKRLGRRLTKRERKNLRKVLPVLIEAERQRQVEAKAAP